MEKTDEAKQNEGGQKSLQQILHTNGQKLKAMEAIRLQTAKQLQQLEAEINQLLAYNTFNKTQRSYKKLAQSLRAALGINRFFNKQKKRFGEKDE